MSLDWELSRCHTYFALETNMSSSISECWVPSWLCAQSPVSSPHCSKHEERIFWPNPTCNRICLASIRFNLGYNLWVFQSNESQKPSEHCKRIQLFSVVRAESVSTVIPSGQTQAQSPAGGRNREMRINNLN